MASIFRHAVSKKKRRFEKDGFDLDLTYITDRIVAMGFPSSGGEQYYRNPLPEIKKFYERYHHDHYKLYNLCAERVYDYSKFHNRVSYYPFFDHNAPSVSLIKECCEDVHEWLGANDKHVVGINCKAGKGRTGLIICCYLIYSGKCETTDKALKMYGERRTKNGKGVTIASQQRYIRYFERVVREFKGEIPRAPKMILKKLVITSHPKLSGKDTTQHVSIEIDNVVTFTSAPQSTKGSGDSYTLDIDGVVKGDCKIQIISGKKNALCHFWFNTGFVDQKTMQMAMVKSTIDVANKDRKCKVFKEDFTITAHFEACDDDDEISEVEEKEEKEEKKEKKSKGKKGKTGKKPVAPEKESESKSDKESKTSSSSEKKDAKKSSESEKSEQKVEKKSSKKSKVAKKEESKNKSDSKSESNGESDSEGEKKESASRKRRGSFYDYEEGHEYDDVQSQGVNLSSSSGEEASGTSDNGASKSASASSSGSASGSGSGSASGSVSASEGEYDE
eukprot:TRINITY_DN1909_c0_g1_i1.p1 TRINITY_DN1909_c0_g1~~TRINITY_DN1909_c0_g1_i1.p1  ORF type:complete len:527 (-),score=187.76 TRINITY_DN1909_c0_g1_i1:214-1725(-)